jgi:hypothetical protein
MSYNFCPIAKKLEFFFFLHKTNCAILLPNMVERGHMLKILQNLSADKQRAALPPIRTHFVASFCIKYFKNWLK